MGIWLAIAAAPAHALVPKAVRVVLDDDYAPYSFVTEQGRLEGILVDQWRLWEEQTGVQVEIHGLDWGEALRRMQAGEFDVIDSIFETPERRAYFAFTPAYTTVEASIYFRKDLSGLTSAASLGLFAVGVKSGDQHADKLRAVGATNLVSFPRNQAIVAAAKEQRVNVFVVDNPAARYLLYKMGIEEEFRHSTPIFRDELHRAVRKGNTAMLRTVSDGFAALDPDQLKAIDEKWFGRTIDQKGRQLVYAVYLAAAALLLLAVFAGWNRTLRSAVLRRTGELQAVSRRLVELQESERRSLARELHDQVGQNLTALKINLSILHGGFDLDSRGNDEMQRRVDDSTLLLESTINTIKGVLYDLRPPMLDQFGLTAALEWHARKFTVRTSIAVIVFGDVAIARPPPEVDIALYRIVQEALNNVANHANARRVEIRINDPDGMLVMSMDNGVGMSRGASSGLGMITMRERAEAMGARLEVDSQPGEGTRITVRMPITWRSGRGG